jgi:hypothetical protein
MFNSLIFQHNAASVFKLGKSVYGHFSFVTWSDKHCSRLFSLLDTVISWFGLWDTVWCPIDKNTLKLRCPADIVRCSVDQAMKLRCE